MFGEGTVVFCLDLGLKKTWDGLHNVDGLGGLSSTSATSTSLTGWRSPP
jgi:hypothetical protein